MSLTTNEIRKAFLDYFEKKNHEIVLSSSLIPGNDPTLLFTNAGMVQFKEMFLGLEKRPYSRATSSQRCVRAGGKHNDLENVGYTARHHTFFEMLGNFSFGDYFKKEAIRFAWEFLTEVLKLPKNKLWITVFKDDKEAEDIWFNDIGIDKTRFSRCGEKDNFWQMGDTGPCGPCTEIFYDHGCEIPGGPPGSPDEDGDRYIEIWNLVFMQYDRDESGKLTPLPKPCVDTGMGLERIAAVIQGVHDNYDIDLFQNLLKALGELTSNANSNSKSMRVIVDHIRSTSFLIADGVLPSNEGRGYVLRRIIRRAIRHGHKLGMKKIFFYKMVKPLCETMGLAYPELIQNKKRIEETLKSEEEKFVLTLDNGLNILEKQIPLFTNKEIPGEVIFQLYDTYGFPPDLTADIAREHGFSMDMIGFDRYMEKQRKTSQSAKSFKMARPKHIDVEGDTRFVGYEQLSCEANILAVLVDEHSVKHMDMDQQGIIVLDKTPFYAESGGQVGDTGSLLFNGGCFVVKDTIKQGQIYLHLGILESGTLKTGMKVTAEVDKKNRRAVMLNHSATHLLHEALRRVLGDHVMQKGSLVEAKRLRFDFSHSKALTLSEIRDIENLVNEQIRLNLQSELDVMTPDEAKQKGAMALFGEKYGDQVRVLKMGDFSTEICGGTHVDATGLIGLFKITNETACASGIRRIEAVTGEGALAFINTQEDRLLKLAYLLKTKPDQLENKVAQLLDENDHQQKELNKLKQHQANQKASDLTSQMQKVGNLFVLATLLHDLDRDALRNMLDDLRVKHEPAAILLASLKDNSVILVSSVDESCFDAFTAPDLLKFIAEKINGKGGGRKDLAQGGGDPDPKLEAYLKDVPSWIQAQIK